MSLTPIQLANLKLICEAAYDSQLITDLPMQLTVAQCIIESSWLKVAPANNCFGIKDTDRYEGCHYCLTKEYINGEYITKKLAFEAYPSLSECFVDHSRLITLKKPYAKAWKNYKDYGSVIQLISEVASVYATDINYKFKLYTLNSMTEVSKAIFETKLRSVSI